MKSAKIRNRHNQSSTTPDQAGQHIWESDKTRENITYKIAKRPALQVTTRLLTVWQRQLTQKDPQKKYRLGTVSKKTTGGLETPFQKSWIRPYVQCLKQGDEPICFSGTGTPRRASVHILSLSIFT